MAAVCEVCGKHPSFGMNLSHSHRRTKRRWDPNIQRVRAIVNGSPRRLHVCTSCIRAGKVTKPPRRASLPALAEGSSPPHVGRRSTRGRSGGEGPAVPAGIRGIGPWSRCSVARMLTSMLGALVNLNHTGHYLHWGFIQISVANLVVIVLDGRGIRRRGRRSPSGPVDGTDERHIVDRPRRRRHPRADPVDDARTGARGRADVDRPPPGRGGQAPPSREAAPRPPAELRGVMGLHLRHPELRLVRRDLALGGRCSSCEGPSWWHQSKSGCSSTASTSGASSSSSSSWSCTCGASSSWRPGGASGPSLG